ALRTQTVEVAVGERAQCLNGRGVERSGHREKSVLVEVLPLLVGEPVDVDVPSVQRHVSGSLNRSGRRQRRRRAPTPNHLILISSSGRQVAPDPKQRVLCRAPSWTQRTNVPSALGPLVQL